MRDHLDAVKGGFERQRRLTCRGLLDAFGPFPSDYRFIA